MVKRSGRKLVASLMILGSLLASPDSSAADPAPNIVLIVADDLGWGDVGFNGRTEWTTPHMDGLAARGLVLKRCYAAAPVCGPSRASLLTGKYTIHCGVRHNDQDLPATEVTIAEALRERGYKTAAIGKWQAGKPAPGQASEAHPLDQGFEEFFGQTDAFEALEKFPVKVWQNRDRVPAAGYIDDLITDRAVDFVSRHKSSPFFLYVAYLAPHFAIDAPADEIERHKGKVPEADPARLVSATYAAMVTRLDRNIGRLLAALDRLGLARNTVIVFTSDNGATFEFGNQGASATLDSNRPLRGQKRTLWEGGIRVPALVCWPAQVPGGRVSQENVHLIDIFPTLVSAAGGASKPSWRVDGANLLPLWTSNSGVPGRTLFWEWRSEGVNQLAAMRGNYKLVVPAGFRPELFDVAADPAERRDLSAVQPRQVKQLQGQLDAWLATDDRRGAE